jgi:hypothetical protein
VNEAQRHRAFAELGHTLADQLVGACLDSIRVRRQEHWREDFGYWLALLDDGGKEVFTFAIPDNVAAYLQYEIEQENLRQMIGGDL